MILARRPIAGKLTFLALNLAILALIVLGLLAPAWRMVEERMVAVAEKGEVLARYQQIAAAEGQASTYARQIRDRNVQGGLIEGGNEGAASASLQARLQSAAESEGAVVRSLSALPSRALGQGQMIGARVEYAGTLAAVTRTIHKIEAGPALLVVTAASLRPRREARIGSAEEPQVDAQLDVYGGFKEARP